MVLKMGQRGAIPFVTPLNVLLLLAWSGFAFFIWGPAQIPQFLLTTLAGIVLAQPVGFVVGIIVSFIGSFFGKKNKGTVLKGR